MKRVKEAALYQTLHFTTNEVGDADYNARLIRSEVEMYKNALDRKRVKYKIVSEETLDDGTVLLKIIRQNINYPIGSYLD